MFSVVIASSVFDPLGYVALDVKPDSEIGTISRRITRTATLDGGATIEDNGYAPADATINLTVRLVSVEYENLLMRLVKLYPFLVLSTRYGAFLGAVDYFKPSGATGALRFLVTQQLSL